MMPGKPVADAVFADLAGRVDALRAAGHNPTLGTILVGSDSASAGYIRIKQERAAELGFGSAHVHLPDDATQADVVAAVRAMSAAAEVDAVLVQHPTPAHIDYEAALGELDPDKDADGQHPVNMGRLALGMPGPLPCTPAGIEALLAHYDIPVAGRDVVILGRGFTLGRPLSLLLSLKRPTANAAVTVVHSAVPDWPAYTRRASIVIAAAGVPGILQPEHIRPGRGGRRRRGALRRSAPAGRRRRALRGGRRLDHPADRRGGADDDRHAVPQHRRGRRATRWSLSGPADRRRCRSGARLAEIIVLRLDDEIVSIRNNQPPLGV